MTKIAILEYSLYGHINQLSRSIKKGIESVGVEVQHLRCAETLPSEVLEQMHAPPKPEDVRELTPANVNELEGFDGIMFGVSARYGGIPAQMKPSWTPQEDSVKTESWSVRLQGCFKAPKPFRVDRNQ